MSQPDLQRSSDRSLPRSSDLVFWVASFCLAAIIFAVYSPALGFQFILDDHRFTNDSRIQFSGYVGDYFTTFVWSQVNGAPPSFYRPLFLLWMRLNFVLCALSPWGWHLLSILKHLAVAALLAVLVWRLLRDRIAALLAATLFALHPAQTESVAWVTVPDPLMTVGVLVALLLFLRYWQTIPEPGVGRSTRVPSPSSSARPMLLLASAAAYFLALLAKETAIVLPVAIFALAMLPRATGESLGSKRKFEPGKPKSRTLQALLACAPFLALTVIYLLMRLSALGEALSPKTQHLPLSTVLLSWPSILCFYLKVLFWPVRSRAFADPILVDSFSARSVLLPALLVLCFAGVIAGLAWWVLRRAHHEPLSRQRSGIPQSLILGWILLALPLVLTLNLNALNPGDSLHGRYTYLPLAGLMLLIATAWHCLGKLRVALLAFAAVIAAISGYLTLQQESQWQDDITVFTVAHQLAPHNAPVAKNLADARVQQALQLEDSGECGAAIPVFQQVIAEFPDDWYAWAALGDCSVQLGQLPEAERALHRAADISHDAKVTEQWQQVRSRMGLSAPSPHQQ